MIARAAALLFAAWRVVAACAMPNSTRSMGIGTPMRPVEHTST